MRSTLRWIMVVLLCGLFSFIKPASAGEMADWIAKTSHKKVTLAQARQIESAVYKHSFDKGLDPGLVLKLIGVESSYRWWAKSNKNAVGLMQVVPRYHGKLIKQVLGRRGALYQIEGNIAVGTEILRSYIAHYGGEDAGIRAYYGDHKRDTYLNKIRNYPAQDSFTPTEQELELLKPTPVFYGPTSSPGETVSQLTKVDYQ